MTSYDDDIDLDEGVSFDEDYMIVLSEEELLALGHACELMADAFKQLGEALPQVVEQVANMAKDVR